MINDLNTYLKLGTSLAEKIKNISGRTLTIETITGFLFETSFDYFIVTHCIGSILNTISCYTGERIRSVKKEFLPVVT